MKFKPKQFIDANSRVSIFLLAAFFFMANSRLIFAQAQPETSDAITNPSLLDDPKIIAAIVAATITVLVNAIGKLIFDRRLEAFKAELSTKASEESARIQYELEAKKRLYVATGHLRFQLLLAARDVANHIVVFGKNERRYPTTAKNYYGQSTIYKLLKPLALCEMIESQISFADFSVDPDAVDLLRLKRAIYTAFTSGRTILDNPEANWEKQEQHIFYHSLSRIANSIIKTDSNGIQSIIPFYEFEEYIKNADNSEKLEPFPRLLEDFNIEDKPLLWLRFVLYGFLCAEFVNQKGKEIGFSFIDYPIEDLIKETKNQLINGQRVGLIAEFQTIRDAGI